MTRALVLLLLYSIEQKESNNVKTLNDLDFNRMLEYSPPPNSIEKPKKPMLAADVLNGRADWFAVGVSLI